MWAPSAWSEDGQSAPTRRELAENVWSLLEKARQGDVEAQYRLAALYEKHSPIQDVEEALYWARKAADSGHLEALNLLGWIHSLYHEFHDYDLAFSYYKKAADRGHGDSMYDVGIAYWKARGVAKDVRQACSWFQRAEAAGAEDADYWMGRCYFGGKLFSKDRSRAIGFMKKAQDYFLHDRDAKETLQHLELERGEVVPPEEFPFGPLTDEPSGELRDLRIPVVTDKALVVFDGRGKKLLKVKNRSGSGKHIYNLAPSLTPDRKAVVHLRCTSSIGPLEYRPWAEGQTVRCSFLRTSIQEGTSTVILDLEDEDLPAGLLSVPGDESILFLMGRDLWSLDPNSRTTRKLMEDVVTRSVSPYRHGFGWYTYLLATGFEGKVLAVESDIGFPWVGLIDIEHENVNWANGEDLREDLQRILNPRPFLRAEGHNLLISHTAPYLTPDHRFLFFIATTGSFPFCKTFVEALDRHTDRLFTIEVIDRFLCK